MTIDWNKNWIGGRIIMFESIDFIFKTQLILNVLVYPATVIVRNYLINLSNKCSYNKKQNLPKET